MSGNKRLAAFAKISFDSGTSTYSIGSQDGGFASLTKNANGDVSLFLQPGNYVSSRVAAITVTPTDVQAAGAQVTFGVKVLEALGVPTGEIRVTSLVEAASPDPSALAGRGFTIQVEEVYSPAL